MKEQSMAIQYNALVHHKGNTLKQESRNISNKLLSSQQLKSTLNQLMSLKSSKTSKGTINNNKTITTNATISKVLKANRSLEVSPETLLGRAIGKVKRPNKMSEFSSPDYDKTIETIANKGIISDSL